MDITLHVPDSVIQAIRLPEKGLQDGLLRELAVALYAQAVLPFGKARELAGVTRRAFAHILEQRGVARHYGRDELADDLGYAGGLSLRLEVNGDGYLASASGLQGAVAEGDTREEAIFHCSDVLALIVAYRAERARHDGEGADDGQR